MKKILLTAVAALGVFVACEKDDIAALNDDFGQIIARVDGDIADNTGLISDLRSDFNAFVEDINERLASAVEALEAADQALEDLINAGLAELNEKLEKAVLALSASIEENTDLIKAVGVELNEKIAAEASARAANDLLIANELADQVAKLQKQDSTLLRHIERNATDIGSLTNYTRQQVARLDAADAAIRTQIATISSTLVSLESDIDLVTLSVVDVNNEIDSNDEQIATLISELNTAEAGIEGLSSDLESLSSRVSALETMTGTISSSLGQITNNFNVATSSINGGTRVSITVGDDTQSFDVLNGADGDDGDNGNDGTNGTNGTNGIDGDSFDGALFSVASASVSGGTQVTISYDGSQLAQFTVADGQGGTGGASIVWGPELGVQTSDFTQTGNLDGASLSRLVSVVPGTAVNTPGATTVVESWDGFDSLELAQAALTATGTHTIVKSTVTTIADGTSVITYTATADNGNIAVGSHDVSSVLPGSSSTATENIQYVVEDNTPQVFDPSTVTSWSPAFDTQEADFVQNGVDGNGISGSRNIEVSAGEAGISYYYGGNLSPVVGTRIGTNEQVAQDAAQELANTAGVAINLYTRTVTIYTASEGLGTHTVTSEWAVSATYNRIVVQDPADVWTQTGTYGGEVTEGQEFEANVVQGTAASNVASVTVTFDIHRNDVTAAAGTIETLSVNGEADEAGTVDGQTRRTQISGSSTNLVVVSTGNTRVIANPDYRAIVPTWTDGSIDINSVDSNLQAVSSVYSHNVYPQTFTVTFTEDFLGNFYTADITSDVAGFNETRSYDTLAQAVAAAKAAIVAAQ